MSSASATIRDANLAISGDHGGEVGVIGDACDPAGEIDCRCQIEGGIGADRLNVLVDGDLPTPMIAMRIPDI